MSAKDLNVLDIVRSSGAEGRSGGQATSLHERVTAGLRRKINDGTLRPGSPISERALCEELAISRTPLREALKVLASENLVQLLPGRGAIVAPVSVETIGSKFEVLAALEGLAIALVCRHATPKALDNIVALHKSIKECLGRGDSETYFRLNQQFHSTIVRLAANPVLADAQEALSAHVRRARHEAVLQDVDLAQAFAEHDQIVKALAKRDEARARSLMERHVLNVGESVVRHFRERRLGAVS